MNNESNVNASQNPNVSNGNVVPNPVANNNSNVVAAPNLASAPVPGPVAAPVASNNNLQTIVVPSETCEETTVTTGTVNMPSIVNPLEVKPDEVKPEFKPVVKKEENLDNEPKKEKVSQYQEKLKQAQENYQPPSKFKMFMNIFWITLVVLIGMFMPEISSGFNKLIGSNSKEIVPEITTGTLVCELKSNTSNLDNTYTRKFKYEDKKLKSLVMETSTRGDVTLDENTLDELNNKCNVLKKNVENVKGIQVACEYSAGLLIKRERFDYKSYDKELINSAYSESGNTVTEFDYDSNIDEVMKSMRQAGFTCNKEK